MLVAGVFVLGPGGAGGTQLFMVGGATSNDQVQVNPAGASNTGSTGVKVQASLNGVNTQTTYNQSFTTIYVFLQGGNENIQLANSLTISAVVTAGNGNDNVQLGSGNNTVALGNGNDYVQTGNGSDVIAVGAGNDTIQTGNGNKTITAGTGNDNVQAGTGTDVVTLGSGNDNTTLGNGNNVVVEGAGNDNVQAGNGDNLIVAGLGKHTVQVGNGSNILIDGAVTLNEGDSLSQVLSEWMLYGASPTQVADIRSRLHVTYDAHHANHLSAGSGLDWFWVMYGQDTTNKKLTDLLN